MDEQFDHLTTQLGQIEDLRAAAEVLEWDQETYMPDGAAEARAHQIGTLRTMAHELFTEDALGELLDALSDDARDLDPLSDEASLVRVTRRDYDKARRIPADLVGAIAAAVARGKQAWRTAREEDDFSIFAPHLERLIDLNIEKAEALGYDDRIYDALLDQYEPGMTTAEVEAVFDDLRPKLVDIVEAIAAQEAPPDDVLHRHYDADQQWDFGMQVLRDFGYDFERGRQDLSTHPFTTSFSVSDVRLTTRVNEQFLPAALFGTLHECGHGLYEQGIDPALDRTPLADGTSLGMHESQSRLWENLVGRSRAFWSHYYPTLQTTFPEQLGDVALDAFYRAINRVEPSLIRVEADEVTYNLHIMLRFELEQAMVEQRVAVDDLPALWNAKMDEYLGLRPETDAEGVLQDIHWSLGAIGYFPTYALGNLMSVQIFDAAREALPDLDAQIAEGRFADLHKWLRIHIYQYGRKLQAPDLLERVTSRSLSAEPWLAYVRQKYGALYDGLR
ncbi:MAG: carboxypeptidase M32 [Bacteroidetes bacterium]|jgi:carboxypeptidase Taq|nr:carboxypeptidase M32 [Bacteroidota bacterium]